MSIDLRNSIFIGSAGYILANLPESLVDTIVTSPPYFGHRKYGTKTKSEEIGCEENVETYIGNIVSTFTNALRVLKPTGSMWLNLGDTYRDGRLLGIPWRVAIALNDHGWILRSEVIWNKPNAMPSSVKNRPTTSHEHLFLFSKSPEYYYDADAIREEHVTFSAKSKMTGGKRHFQNGETTPERGKFGGNSNLHTGNWDKAFHPLGRNKRTVWDIPLGKFKGAHMAVFPPKTLQTCLAATLPKNGIVLDPFFGAGTTGLVALEKKGFFVGIELYPEFVKIAAERIGEDKCKIVKPLSSKRTTVSKSSNIDKSA